MRHDSGRAPVGMERGILDTGSNGDLATRGIRVTSFLCDSSAIPVPIVAENTIPATEGNIRT